MRWPYAYHLTSTANLLYLQSTGALYSARELCVRFDRNPDEVLNNRRGIGLVLAKDGVSVHIRDQAPLYEANVLFEDGWDFRQLLDALNGRCFFWSGTANGPNPYGLRHFARYEGEHPLVLRVPASGLTAELEFCRFNSGSPRWSRGEASPRGPHTFRPAAECDFKVGRIVEVTVRQSVVLPPTTEYGPSPSGPWTPVFP
jgi:hypothetical protein